MMSARRFVSLLVIAAALIVGCGKIAALQAPAFRSGSADFSVVAAMGTSISAGFESGGLVVTHQQRSFPYLFARQVHVASFTIPSISPDGIPPLLQILSLSPLIVSNVGRVLGSPTNLTQPSAYHNMGIPGAVVFDVADSSAYHSAPNPVGRTNFTYFDLIQRRRGTILTQVASLSPTFVSFEYGVNEALGPAIAGGTIPVLPAATFAVLLHGTLDALEAVTSAKFAIANVPDVTTIPFVTTFPPAGALDGSGNPTPTLLIGSEGGGTGPLGYGDYVLLSAADSLAAGTGFPVGTFSYLTGAAGNGRPLPNSMVLSSTEAAAISSTVNAYNNTIAAEAAARGMALVDFHGLLQQAATTGIHYQGTTYTSAYITGGLFSLDGIHPNDLAQGLVCNAMIASVNQTFGSNLPPVNLSAAATLSSSRAKPAGARVWPWLERGEALVDRLLPGRPPAL